MAESRIFSWNAIVFMDISRILWYNLSVILHAGAVGDEYLIYFHAALGFGEPLHESRVFRGLRSATRAPPLDPATF